MRNLEYSGGNRVPGIVAITAVIILLGSMLTIIPGIVENANAVLFVGPNSTYGSIQDAIDDSAGSETIYIEGGTYNETVKIDKQNITLMGNKSFPVTIVGQDDPYAVIISEEGASLVNLIIESGGVDINKNRTTISNISVQGDTDSPVDAVGISDLRIT